MMSRTLKAASSIFRIQIASGLQYRLSAFAGSTTSIFWAMIECIVISTFYLHAKDYNAELTLNQSLSYIWIGQMLVCIQMNMVGGEIMAKIKGGDVGIELCRPLSLHTHWFCKIASSKIAPLILRGIPVVIAGALIPKIRLSPPASAWGVIAMIAATVGALFLSSSIMTFSCGILLNVKWGEGPVNIFSVLTMVLSGNYFPLQLWPDFMQKFLLYQPFSGMLDIPIRFYIGTLSPVDIFKVLPLQFTWTLFFIVIGKILFRYNLKRLVVQGG